MQAASTRGRKAAVDGRDISPELDRVFSSARQGYLDALPVAAAILSIDDDSTTIECANEHFRLVAEWDERMGDRLVAHVPLLRAGPVGSRLSAFLKSDDPAYQFDTADGRSVGGRHFTVRFARLTRLPGHPERLLVS